MNKRALFCKKKSVKTRSYFFVLIFILCDMIFCQLDRINNFYFLQWVRANKQSKNNNKKIGKLTFNLLKSCNRSYDNRSWQKQCQLSVICHRSDDDFISCDVIAMRPSKNKQKAMTKDTLMTNDNSLAAIRQTRHENKGSIRNWQWVIC